MNYRLDKYGNPLSILGYGCMRFPRKQGKIDMAVTESLIRLAVENGVNYFDTAYIYPGSEAAVGEILEKTGLRSRVNIATKLPHYLIKNREGLDRLFAEELRRLRTDHVDYYLMHMLNDIDTWERLKAMGIEEWIAEKKRSGAIRQVGFSYHGGSEMFCKILDAYDWEFCQVQYNYLDEHSQAGRRGVAYAHQKGIPVIIMEPLRGGRLVQLLPERAKQLFAQQSVKRSPAEWGLRWLWDQEAVTVVLSGMGEESMLRENMDIAAHVSAGELTEADRDLYAQVVQAINEGVKVGCTGCGYCQPCPKGVDIPGAFAAYNRWHGEDKAGAFMDYLKCTTLRKNATAAGNCIGCGKCEQHCPQGIPIRQELKEVQKTFETPVYRIARKCLGWFAHF
ncbi:MAG: aldo/keto reductase [Oscillospiraceae bacterium]|nr:aldo/keto reductase [Oscillospiraceae bacterium]